MARGWTSRTVRRYLALQLPGTALLVAALLLARSWLEFPGWVFWTVVAAWLAKDLVLFPFVWKAYDAPDGSHPIVGENGVARDRLAPSGYVRIGGELWKAKVPEGGPAIEPGGAVRVRKVEGVTLVVEPAPERQTGAHR